MLSVICKTKCDFASQLFFFFFYCCCWFTQCFYEAQTIIQSISQVYSINKPKWNSRALYPLCRGDASFPLHAHSAGDGFFWEHCTRWPILAPVCLHGRWLSILPVLSAPISWSRTNTFSWPVHWEEHSFFLLKSRWSVCVLFVSELFNVPGQYRRQKVG